MDQLLPHTKKELQELAQDLNLKCSGNKSQLCLRIIPFLDALKHANPKEDIQYGGNEEGMCVRCLQQVPKSQLKNPVRTVGRGNLCPVCYQGLRQEAMTQEDRYVDLLSREYPDEDHRRTFREKNPNLKRLIEDDY